MKEEGVTEGKNSGEFIFRVGQTTSSLSLACYNLTLTHQQRGHEDLLDFQILICMSNIK